jgi:hypothetical protein
MKAIVSKSLGMLAALAFAGSLVSASVWADEHESKCFDEVQGKVPWAEGKLNWEPENVKQLCKGTTHPLEPGKCFTKVRTERVNWGGGTDWEWKNIINLCAGTNNAEQTVECFQKGVKGGADWRDAILTCQRNNIVE